MTGEISLGQVSRNILRNVSHTYFYVWRWLDKTYPLSEVSVVLMKAWTVLGTLNQPNPSRTSASDWLAFESWPRHGQNCKRRVDRLKPVHKCQRSVPAWSRSHACYTKSFALPPGLHLHCRGLPWIQWSDRRPKSYHVKHNHEHKAFASVSASESPKDI